MKKIFFILGLILSIQLVGQTEKPETIAVIHTTLGDITVKLNNDTPLHRDNFIKLVNEGWYEDSPFHRVINNFMIQGGHNKDGKVDPGYTIFGEVIMGLDVVDKIAAVQTGRGDVPVETVTMKIEIED